MVIISEKSCIVISIVISLRKCTRALTIEKFIRLRQNEDTLQHNIAKNVAALQACKVSKET